MNHSVTSTQAQKTNRQGAVRFEDAIYDRYCIETEYCDVSHPEVQALALELTAGLDSTVEQVRALFNWVRDEIKYVISHDWSLKASETLAVREGCCTNKANLLIALLRAVGIPAAYELLRVRGKFYLGPAWIPMLKDLCDDISAHVRVTVYLNGRWMKCDPTNDSVLSESVSHFNPTAGRAIFDGENDALSFVDPDHVLGIMSPISDGDPILGKRTRKPAIFFQMFNRFLEFGREHGACYHGALEPIESMFQAWMQYTHPGELEELDLTIASMTQPIVRAAAA